jgi:hypothetical protein
VAVALAGLASFALCRPLCSTPTDQHPCITILESLCGLQAGMVGGVEAHEESASSHTPPPTQVFRVDTNGRRCGGA